MSAKKQTKIRPRNFYTITGWMILMGLSGSKLDIYSIIYGFSQDGLSSYSGGVDYLMQWAQVSRRKVFNDLADLVRDGLILKSTVRKNNVDFSEFRVSLDAINRFLGSAQDAPVEGSAQGAPVHGMHGGSAQDTSAGSAQGAPNNKDIKKESIGITPISPSSDVQKVFDCWKQVMQSDRSVLDNSRRRKIETALKRFSVEDCCKAIHGCRKSAYHMGDNPKGIRYNSIDLIFRNADKIEQFMGYLEKTPDKKPDSIAERNARLRDAILNRNEPFTIDMEG